MLKDIVSFVVLLVESIVDHFRGWVALETNKQILYSYDSIFSVNKWKPLFGVNIGANAL